MLCGIDPSFTGCSASVFNSNKLIDFVFLNINNSINLMDRIVFISSDIISFLHKNSIKKVNIELPIYNRFNPKTYAIQNRLLQQILYDLMVNDIVYKEFEPKEVKKVFGSGSLKKDKMIEYVEHNLKLAKSFPMNELLHVSTKPITEGLCDSIAVGLCDTNIKDYLIGR